MAEDRMAVLETVREAIAEGDVDFLRESVRVLAQAVMEAEGSELTGAAKALSARCKTGTSGPAPLCTDDLCQAAPRSCSWTALTRPRWSLLSSRTCSSSAIGSTRPWRSSRSAVTSTMDPTGAAQAVEFLGVTDVAPMHYGTFPILAGTPDQLRAALADRGLGHVDVHAATPGHDLS